MPDRDRLERPTDDSFDRGGVRYSVHSGLSAAPFSRPRHSSLSGKVSLDSCLGWPPAWKIKSTVLMFLVIGQNSDYDRIASEVVKKACERLKPGKSDVSESYQSDVFLHAPDTMFDALAAVFRSFLVCGTVTLSILSCAFLPLYKGGHKKPDNFTSYRAISGASQFLKLWEYVVMEV